MSLLKSFENFKFEISFRRVHIVCPLFTLNVDIESRTAEFVWGN